MLHPSKVKGFNDECDICIEHEIAFQNMNDIDKKYIKTRGLIIGNLKRHCESGKHRKR